MVKDVATVEIRTRDLRGPMLARELSAGPALVTVQEWTRRLLVNFRRVTHVGSTGLDLHSARHRPGWQAFRKRFLRKILVSTAH
jgi:hypothetical protein